MPLAVCPSCDGDVTVAVRQGEKLITANGVNGDTVMASVEAILKGMNRLLDKQGA